MNHQATNQNANKFVLLMVAGIILSLVWWYLAVTGIHSKQIDVSLSLLIVLGGFLPAAIGIVLLNAVKHEKGKTFKNHPWVIIAFVSYPVLIMFVYFSQIFTGQWDIPPDWIYHPGLLIFNLMAVLLIGPIGDSLGFKAHATDYLKAKFPTNKGKLIAIFSWWVWHLPFIFLNGSALSALNFLNSFLAAYLLTILGV
ncbi:MAG: hypothetical protein ACOCYU_04115, partial [Brevefilum sp.]